MNSHSDCANTLPSDSPLLSLRDSLTLTHATHVPDSDYKGLTPNHQVISARSESHRRTFYTAAIDILPNEVLLNIFDHIRRSRPDFKSGHIPVWKWHPLVHVCRRWREIVFASPRSLNLQLLCTNGTPVRKNLACWPDFPIVVHYNTFEDLSHKDEDNIIAALEHRSRICQIKLTVSSSVWSRITTVMLKPFPALTSLSVSSWPRNVSLLCPINFLGGSTPSLQKIRLQGFPTIALPTLFTHTSDLVKLDLIECHTHLASYLSPAGLVVCLASLPRLKNFSIKLPLSWTRTSNPDRWQKSLPDNTQIILPALSSFAFNGACIYLEDLVAKIDAPELNSLDITFWDSREYRIPQLSDFVINRTALKPSRFKDAKLSFVGDDLAIIDWKDGLGLPLISIEIPLCSGRNRQVWCVAQVLRQASATFSNVVRLEIEAESCDEDDGDMRNVDWSKLLCPFTAVETLNVYADSDFAEKIARALEYTLAEPDNKVPALNLLYVEGVGVSAESIVLPGRNCTITVRCQEPDSEFSDLDLEDD